MAFVLETGYTLGGSDEPLTHARILHQGNRHTQASNTDGGTTAVASSTFSKDGPLNGLTYNRWKPNAASSTYEISLGTSRNCTIACIGAHTLGTEGCTVDLQYDSGGGTWVTVESNTPTDDTAIMFLFDTISAENWRLNITGGAPEIGVFWIGRDLQMERPLYGGFSPIQMSRNTTLRGNVSQKGEWLGRSVIRRNYGGTLTWSNLSASWVRTNLDMTDGLLYAMEREPFFVAWRPDTFEDEVFLAWTTGSVNAPNNAGIRDLMTFSFDFEAFPHD